MSYLYDIFFIFIFIMMNKVISFKPTHFFAHFLEYVLLFLDDSVDQKQSPRGVL